MLGLLQNEYVKVSARRGFKIACILFIILATIPIIINSIIVDETEKTIINGIIIGLLSLSGIYILFSTSNLLLADELKSGKINLIATCPFKRWKILLSKYIAILSINLIYTLALTALLSFSLIPISWWISALTTILFYWPLCFLLSVLLKSSKTLIYILGYAWLTNVLQCELFIENNTFLNYSFGICTNNLISKLVEYMPTIANEHLNNPIENLNVSSSLGELSIVYIINLIVLTVIPFVVFQKRDLK